MSVERLVGTDGRGDTTKQGGHLGTGLSESENVVDEQQHILTLLITEYSAIVRPVKATRARAPGGSFI